MLTVKQLIEELQKMPEDATVCIMDFQKNLASDNGDGSYEGIYPDFDVEHITEVTADSKPFVALTFDTDPPVIEGYNGDKYSQIE